MRKKVWILNHYAGCMLFEKGGRHYWFAKYLNKNGYSPVIFCSNVTSMSKWIDTEKLWVEKIDTDINTPFVYVKSSPYKGNGLARIKNMIRFYRNVKKTCCEYAKKNGKPSIIYASSVHPLTLVAGIQLARRFGVKCICEVRDLWPEAIVTYSKRVKKNSILARILYAGEKWIYKKANAVIFTQEGGPQYVAERGWDKRHGGPIKNEKLYYINNGVDLEAFDSNVIQYHYNDPDLDNEEKYNVVYAGAIRMINNLGIILESAKQIKNPRIQFLIFGDGDELDGLKERVERENITNVIFKGEVNKQFIPSIVSKADLNLVHWQMSPLLRFGESYNKAFEYFAAKKPVFYTIRPGYSIVEKYQCGIITSGFEPKDIAIGIQKMAEMNIDERNKMAANARQAALDFDFKKLTKKLIEIIEDC